MGCGDLRSSSSTAAAVSTRRSPPCGIHGRQPRRQSHAADLGAMGESKRGRQHVQRIDTAFTALVQLRVDGLISGDDVFFY
jgi:hypothetical protein